MISGRLKLTQRILAKILLLRYLPSSYCLKVRAVSRDYISSIFLQLCVQKIWTCVSSLMRLGAYATLTGTSTTTWTIHATTGKPMSISSAPSLTTSTSDICRRESHLSFSPLRHTSRGTSPRKCQSINQSVRQSASHPSTHPPSQSASQPVSQSASQSMIQWKRVQLECATWLHSSFMPS